MLQVWLLPLARCPQHDSKEQWRGGWGVVILIQMFTWFIIFVWHSLALYLPLPSECKFPSSTLKCRSNTYALLLYVIWEMCCLPAQYFGHGRRKGHWQWLTPNRRPDREPTSYTIQGFSYQARPEKVGSFVTQSLFPCRWYFYFSVLSVRYSCHRTRPQASLVHLPFFSAAIHH